MSKLTLERWAPHILMHTYLNDALAAVLGVSTRSTLVMPAVLCVNLAASELAESVCTKALPFQMSMFAVQCVCKTSAKVRTTALKVLEIEFDGLVNRKSPASMASPPLSTVAPVRTEVVPELALITT